MIVQTYPQTVVDLAQQLGVSREEASRLLFARHLVRTGKLSEFPGCHHKATVRAIARHRAQPKYRLAFLASHFVGWTPGALNPPIV